MHDRPSIQSVHTDHSLSRPLYAVSGSQVTKSMENELLQARSAVNCRGVAEMVRDMAARELGLRRAGYAMVAREITAELAKGCGT